VGHRGGSHQLRRGPANLLLRLRAAATSIAARLTSTTVREHGQDRSHRRQVGAGFVLVSRAPDVPQAAVHSGRQRSPAVSRRSPRPASAPLGRRPNNASQARGAGSDELCAQHNTRPTDAYQRSGCRPQVGLAHWSQSGVPSSNEPERLSSCLIGPRTVLRITERATSSIGL
jgi:hypothetical protein